MIQYQAKDAAIADAIRYLRESDQLSLKDGMKEVRAQAKRQFSSMIKFKRLQAAALGQNYNIMWLQLFIISIYILNSLS